MKVCVICFDFQEKNLRKQPWRYIWEIIQYLSKSGFEITIISDCKNSQVHNFEIQSVKRISDFFGPSQELSEKLSEINPDLIITLVSFISLTRSSFNIDKPVIGVFTSPIYSLKELINVGIGEFLRHPEYLYIHLIGALIPRLLIRNASKNLLCLVALSENTRSKLEQMDLKTKIVLIPPGITDFDFELPDPEKIKIVRQKICPDDIPLIMYFTSPLTIRGTDTLLKAFIKFRKTIPAKLIFLSRIDNDSVMADQNILIKMVAQNHLEGTVSFFSQKLNPEEVKTYISCSDIVCIPFKLVISDVPISILEAMAVGKPVISTNISCVPDLLKDRGIIVNQCDSDQLASVLSDCIKNSDDLTKLGNSGRAYMENYPRWDEVGRMFTELIEDLKIG